MPLRPMQILLVSAALLGIALPALAIGPGDRVDNFRLLDHAGASHELYYLSDAKAIVVMVHGNGCPIVRTTVPRLKQVRDRYRDRGYSSCEFVLRMTREEIGSYLGLKLETVSRLFSKFQRDGLLQVQGRTVKLLDRTSLRQLIENSD